MDKEARRRLGCLVKTHRKAKKLRQVDLAEAVGVSPEHISHIECGTSSVSTELLVRISETLGVSLYTFLEYDAPNGFNENLTQEWAALIASASPEHRRICYTMCKTLLDQLNNNPKP